MQRANDREAFDQLAMQFVLQFERSAPSWDERMKPPADDRGGGGYIAITGALHGIGPADGPPVFPQNLLGDFGGGTMFLIMGVLAALLEARSSGQGQVVDAAIVDGTASLMTMVWSAFEGGWWQDRRGVNLLDGGAPYYDVYATADGGWLAVGSLEPQFFAALVQGSTLALLPWSGHAPHSDQPALLARLVRETAAAGDRLVAPPLAAVVA